MKIKTRNRNLELLFEIGCLRFIQRSWKRFLNPDFENLAEHHFRVAWIALILAKMEKVKNIEKVLLMALAHDIAESRTGDVDYLQRQYVERREDIGLQDMVAKTLLEKDLTQLMEEYEERTSIEAKIVKDADNLDVDFEIKEQSVKGNPIGEGWMDNRKFVMQKKLYTKSAKKMWEEIYAANPHDWHLFGRNRYTSGDWKAKK